MATQAVRYSGPIRGNPASGPNRVENIEAEPIANRRITAIGGGTRHSFLEYPLAASGGASDRAVQDAFEALLSLPVAVFCVVQSMPNIDLQIAIDLAEIDEFWAVRGKAIQSYAILEQTFAVLLSVLSGTSAEVAETILFRISSSDARNKILAKLFRKKFGDQFKLFRNSLFDQLRPIDLERNEIVHWNAVCEVSTDGKKTLSVVALAPPALTGPNKVTPTKSTNDIRLFDEKCLFYCGLVNQFCLLEGNITKKPITDAAKAPWRNIFSQPIIYPPPSAHPLFRKPGAPQSHIQAFLVK